MSQKYPVLIGDIGGTNVRLKLVKLAKDINEPPELIDKTKLIPSKYPSLENLFSEYLSKFKNTSNYPLYIVVGIPGIVQNNEIIKMANIPYWNKTNGDELAKKLQIKKIAFINDFTCHGYGIQSNLKKDIDYIIINDVPEIKDGVKVVIGPGTGLGMGFLIKNPENEFYTIGYSEGGHQDFHPKFNIYSEIREYYIKLLKINGLSIDRICSGQGLIPIYKYLLLNEKNLKINENLKIKIEKFDNFGQMDIVNELNIELVKNGLEKKCELCKKVLELFIGLFGEVCGDASLFYLPTGGLYLTGGLSVVLESLIKETNIFMEHFLNKDDSEHLLKTFPVYLVRNGDLGIIGAGEYARRLILKNEK